MELPRQMTKNSYQECMKWTERNIGITAVRLLVKAITAVTAVVYLTMALWLLGQRDQRLLRFLMVPAAGFVAVTILRKLIAAKRPYEIYGFTPLLQKDTKANSFPSRHVFSNMIIAAAVIYINLPLGIFTAVCGLILAVLRVITGVHFPKDVAAGCLIAVLFGWIGFYLV